MSIPETQLKTWSNQGAIKASADTNTSIQYALSQHTWPGRMNHIVYLQGSYPNATNIRGDSDVDIVVESTNVYYDDMPAEVQKQVGWSQGSYSFNDVRNEVIKALTNYYPAGKVNPDNKCIKVSGDGTNRLNADVVPCITFKHFEGANHKASGIAFWLQNGGGRIVNYPKLHLSNGSTKNANCSLNYKPNVRVFKNARNRAQTEADKFPSFFLECLLYNVPDRYFVASHSSTFYECLDWLDKAHKQNLFPNFTCQNGVQLMFGTGHHQSTIAEARRLIDELISLWNQWS